MIVLENECVGCPPEMGCIGSSCKYKNVPHYYCDKCKDETDIYHFDDRELCIYCIEKELVKVTYET
jgi:hypothetical protein